MATIRKQEPDVRQLPLLADVATSVVPGENGSSIGQALSRLRSHVHSRDQIHIERLIEHELDHINKRVKLADMLVALSEHESYFAEHVGAGDARAEWGACFINPNGDVADWCRSLLGSDDDFIEASRLLANHLYEVMRTKSISRGDLVAAVFTRGADLKRYAALMKLDPDTRRVRNFVGANGKTRAEISLADNIMPDSKSLTKCALITPHFEKGSTDPRDAYLDIRLLDTQAGFRSRGVAAFFFRDFLTTELVPTDRQRTQDFVRGCEYWANHHQPDLTPSELQHFYGTRRHVLGMEHVDIEAFVKDALPARPEFQSDLAEHLLRSVITLPRDDAEAHGIFAVDKVVATPIMRDVVYELDGGARLSVPADRLNDLVHVEHDYTPDGKHRIVIESQTFKEVIQR